MVRFLSRKTLKIVGYPLAFVVFFAAFFVLGFPMDSFHDDFERELTSRLERQVRIGDVGISLTGGLVFSSVEIEVPTDEGEDEPFEAPPENPKEQKKEGPKDSKTKLTYFFDEIVIKVGLLNLLFDRLSLDVDIEGLGGKMSMKYNGPIPSKAPKKSLKPQTPRRLRSKDKEPTETNTVEEPAAESGESTPLTFRVEAEGVSLQRLHDLRKALPVPIAGSADFVVNLESETGLFRDCQGAISLTLKDILLSRKNFEIDIFDMKMAVPPLAIASLAFNVDVKKGTGEISKFTLKSKHFDANVQGSVSLEDPITESKLDLYLTFKVLPAYMDTSDSVKTIVSSLDTFSREMKRAHRDDDYYGFRYRGVPGKGRFTPQTRYTPQGKQAASAKAESRQQRGRSSRKDRASTSSKKTPGPLNRPTVGPSLQDERIREPRDEMPEFPPSDRIPRSSEFEGPRHRPPEIAQPEEEEEEAEEEVSDEEEAPAEEEAVEEEEPAAEDEEGEAAGEEENEEEGEEGEDKSEEEQTEDGEEQGEAEE